MPCSPQPACSRPSPPPPSSAAPTPPPRTSPTAATSCCSAIRYGAASCTPTRALGRVLNLDGQPYAVVGVMPLAAPPGPLVRGESSELSLLGRLRPGATLAQAQGELDAYRRQLEAQTPAA